MSDIKKGGVMAILTAAAILFTPQMANGTQGAASQSRFDRLSAKGQCTVRERAQGIRESFSFGDTTANVGRLTLNPSDLPQLEELLSEKETFKQVKRDAHKVDHLFPTSKRHGIFRRRVYAKLSACEK